MVFKNVLAPFNVQDFKNSLEWIRSFRDIIILGPEWPIYPNQVLR